MEEIDIGDLQEKLLTEGTPTALATIWLVHKLQQLQDELEDVRYQLNSIEAKVNTLHEAKFGA